MQLMNLALFCGRRQAGRPLGRMVGFGRGRITIEVGSVIRAVKSHDQQLDAYACLLD